ncbi:SAM-dependent methyltransferase [Mesorhizobium onobrychidis]|nr:SAM-dependent methyltransferase [Mesorhizobium onobrychidis]
MPIIDIHHPRQTPPNGLLASLCAAVTELLEIPKDHCWAMWHPVAQGNYWRPGWQDAPANDLAGPLVRIRCKSSYSEAQAKALIQLVSNELARGLECSSDSNFIVLDRVEAGQLLARGNIWPGDEKGAVPITLTPVAFVRNDRADLSDDFWGDVVSELELNTSVVPSHSLEGLESFSHAEVVFSFHRVAGKPLSLNLRSPRGLAHLPPIGVLSQRVKDRPNWLGVSRCEILARNGTSLTVRGLDAIDGSPVLDIKPWMDAFGPRQKTIEPSWVSEVMQDYYGVARPSREGVGTSRSLGMLRRFFRSLPFRWPAYSKEDAEILLRTPHIL